LNASLIPQIKQSHVNYQAINPDTDALITILNQVKPNKEKIKFAYQLIENQIGKSASGNFERIIIQTP
jgi:hypothetical protein